MRHRNEQGQSTGEYAILVAMALAIAMALMAIIGPKLLDKARDLNTDTPPVTVPAAPGTGGVVGDGTP